MTRRFKYVAQWTDHLGRQRIRFRRKGQRCVELPGPIGSEQFIAAYHRVVAGEMPTILPRKRKRGEETTGVYLLVLGEELIYIGSSFKMGRRVGSHRTNGRTFDKAFFIRTDPSERRLLEKILIRAFKPRQNHVPTWWSAQNGDSFDDLTP